MRGQACVDVYVEAVDTRYKQSSARITAGCLQSVIDQCRGSVRQTWCSRRVYVALVCLFSLQRYESLDCACMRRARFSPYEAKRERGSTGLHLLFIYAKFLFLSLSSFEIPKFRKCLQLRQLIGEQFYGNGCMKTFLLHDLWWSDFTFRDCVKCWACTGISCLNVYTFFFNAKEGDSKSWKMFFRNFW